MKYLVLSDIHGNCVALDAVLGTVPKSRYDKILVLGDNIGDGPAPDKVVKTLTEAGAIMIAGNREELARDHFAGFAETQTALQWQFMRDSLAFLSDEQKKYLFSLPHKKSFTDGKMNILAVHGSPNSVREVLYKSNHTQLEACLNGIDERILLCGHNHYQFSYTYNDKLVLNPGSVGLSQKGEAFRADYAILNVSNQFAFELNHTYYDGEKIKREYTERGLWDSSVWGRIAYREMSEGKMYIIGFARYVFGLARKKHANTAPIDDDVWLEAAETWDWTPAQ